MHITNLKLPAIIILSILKSTYYCIKLFTYYIFIFQSTNLIFEHEFMHFITY